MTRIVEAGGTDAEAFEESCPVQRVVSWRHRAADEVREDELGVAPERPSVDAGFALPLAVLS
nr:hypothetical protein [Cellulomonas sp. Leaf395]